MRRRGATGGKSVGPSRRTGGNQRALPRIDLQVTIDTAGAGGTLTGASRNISAGGVFVATEQPLRVGDQLKLELKLPDRRETITLDSKVRWVRLRRSAPRAHRPAGGGLQFVNQNTETTSVKG